MMKKINQERPFRRVEIPEENFPAKIEMFDYNLSSGEYKIYYETLESKYIEIDDNTVAEIVNASPRDNCIHIRTFSLKTIHHSSISFYHKLFGFTRKDLIYSTLELDLTDAMFKFLSRTEFIKRLKILKNRITNPITYWCNLPYYSEEYTVLRVEKLENTKYIKLYVVKKGESYSSKDLVEGTLKSVLMSKSDGDDDYYHYSSHLYENKIGVNYKPIRLQDIWIRFDDYSPIEIPIFDLDNNYIMTLYSDIQVYLPKESERGDADHFLVTEKQANDKSDKNELVEMVHTFVEKRLNVISYLINEESKKFV